MTNLQSIPDPQAEDVMRSRAVAWTYVEGVTADQIDKYASYRNQARPVALDDETVKTYQLALEGGESLPAIVVYRGDKGYIIISGNHRFAASENAELPFCAYVVDDRTQPAARRDLTMLLNLHHGLPLDADTRLHAALDLVNQQVPVAEAARRMHLPVSTVRDAHSKQDGLRRAVHAGVRPQTWNKLPDGVKKILKTINTDEGMVALLDLIDKAKLSTSDVQGVAGQIQHTKNGGEQKELVERIAAEDYLREIQKGGKDGARGHGQRHSPRTQLADVGKRILRLPSPEKLAVDLATPGARREAIENLQRAQTALQALILGLVNFEDK